MTLRLAAAVAAAALATVVAVAAAAAAFGLGPALQVALGFEFQHSRDFETFAAIALNNARVALVPFAAALAVPYVSRASVALDALLGLLVLGNCVLVGLALAAYGRRLAFDLAAHGPLELAAMSVALAAYLRARTTVPRGLGGLRGPGAICASLILSAAAAEVWV